MLRFLKNLWLVAVERAKTKKAIRLLSKQSWSVEFLVYLICRASKIKNQGMYLIIKNKEGEELHIRSETPVEKNYFKIEENLDVLAQNVSLESILDAAAMTGEL